MKLNKKYLTIGVIVVALAWMVGTVNGQDGIEMIEGDFDTVVEIEWEEEPIAAAAGYKDASSLGKKGSKSTTKISKSNRQKFAKLFGFKDAAGLGKVKGGTSPVTKSGKKKVAKAFGYKDAATLKGSKSKVVSSKGGKKQIAKSFGYKDAAGLGKVKGGTSPVKQSGKKKVAKAFGYKDAASLKVKGDKKVITISKSDHKQLAKMFGFKAITTSKEHASGKVKLSLDAKQKKLIAKAFGFKDAASLKGEKKKVKFTKSEKNAIKKALRLR